MQERMLLRVESWSESQPKMCHPRLPDLRFDARVARLGEIQQQQLSVIEILSIKLNAET